MVFALFFCTQPCPGAQRCLLRAEPGQEEGWGELQGLLGFFMGCFFAWRMLEGDQWGEKQEKPQEGGAAVLCWVKADA